MSQAKQEEKSSRRDFLYVATAAVGAITVGGAVWPLVNQMNPSADVKALASIEVDVAGVEPGSQLTVKWLGKAARAVPLADLPDVDARNANASPVVGETETYAEDSNRSLDETGEWLVMMGVCTHLGCVPLGDAGDFGGWFCPCHGSHYDTAGRIRKGPAPENLPVPVATFIDANTIKLG